MHLVISRLAVGLATVGIVNSMDFASLHATYNPNATIIDFSNLKSVKDFPKPPDHVKCNDGIQCWVDHKAVGPYTYWEKTAENVYKSGAVDHLKKWIDEYRSSDIFNCHEQKRGPMSCFAATFLADYDFHCRLDQQALCRIPTAEDAMRLVDRQFPMLSAKDKVETARSVYYIMKNFQSIGANTWTLHGIINEMKIEFGDKAMDLIKTFTPQVHAARLNQCRFTEKVLRETISWTLKGFSLATGTYGAHTGWDSTVSKLFPDAGDMMGNNKLYQKIFSEWLNHAETLAGLGELIHSLVNDAAGLKEGNSQGGVPWTPSVDMFILSMTVSKSKGMCGSWFGAGTDDNQQREPEVISYIHASLNKIQNNLADTFDHLIIYEPKNKPSPILDNMASRDYLDSTFRDAKKHLNAVKKDAKQSMLNLFISELLTESRCYIDCEQRPDIADLCNKDAFEKANDITQLSRFCFPIFGARCQMQCLTNQGSNNKKSPVFGIERFREFGFAPGNLMNNSLKQYLNKGNASYFGQTPISNGGILQLAKKALQLPVCWGSHVAWNSKRINDLNHSFRNQLKGAPLYCGPHANETLEFTNRIGLDLQKETNYRERQMARQIKEISPYDQFIGLCETNLRFPYGSKPGHYIRKGRDPRCKQVKLETTFLGPHQANTHFCTMTSVVNGVFKDEKMYIDSLWPTWVPALGKTVHNSKNKCNYYFRKIFQDCTDCESSRIAELVKKAYEEVGGLMVTMNETLPVEIFSVAPSNEDSFQADLKRMPVDFRWM